MTEELSGQVTGIYINEILASNLNSDFDPVAKDYPDWIEIYNSGTTPYKLGGYYLTNDPDNHEMWKIPEGAEITAGGYLSFWADESDAAGHVNFSLNKEKGFIGLFTSTGIAVDSFSYSFQVKDISFGRAPDDYSRFVFFPKPTKGAVNSSKYFSSISGKPGFSLRGGFYSGDQIVELTAENSLARIFYTTNGKEPDSLSLKYTSAITISKTTALRARVYEPDALPGVVGTQTYLINEPVSLPVISIVTDSANFFDNKTGIYITGTNGIRGSCDTTKRNLNQDWERPVNVELYEKDGVNAFNQEAGIKIYGGCSRTRFPQKSLALYARKSYGKGSFDYQLFPDKKIYSFDSFVLRSSADDQVRTFVRDALAQYTGIGMMDLDFQAYRPAIVFLNGTYWGIHDIREKINEQYIGSNFNIGESSVNILQSNNSIVHGTSTEYTSLLGFIASSSLENYANYNFVRSQIDIDQFIDYEILHIYLAERDWPGNNIKYWNSSEVNYKRWRWICFDLDQTFIRTNANTLADATATNGPTWPNPPWSTLLLRSLLNNQDFRNRFIQRYALYLYTIFKPENLEKKALEFKAALEPEIPRHVIKWGGKLDPDFHENWTISPTFSSLDQWRKNYDAIISFIKQRPDYAISHLKSKFMLKGLAQTAINENISGAGSIYVYDRKIKMPDFRGSFFTEIPLLLRAVPNPGYRFLRWDFKGSMTGTSVTAETSVTFSGNEEITAVFEKTESLDPVIIISEINYNSETAAESGDWVELFNRQDAPVDLSGWKLKDSDDLNEFTLPYASVIAANGYMVLCERARDMAKTFNNLINYRGNTGFGFKNGGETIRLYNVDGILVDSVKYDNKFPWPELPDGKGYTLALKDTEMDNNLPENWTSQLKGSPGAPNNLISGIKDHISNYNSANYIEKVYPNPARSFLKIIYNVALPGNIRIAVSDIYGRVLLTPVNKFHEEGSYTVEISTQTFSPGIYFCTIIYAGKLSEPTRFVIIN